MKIIQITDLHIGLDGESPFGVDVRSNAIDVFRKASLEAMDIVILTGDLALNRGENDIYEWIKKAYDDIFGKTPLYIIPGNHDDNSILREVFNIRSNSQDEIYFTLSQDDIELICLDTGKGQASENQKEWLYSKISEHLYNQCLVFMHYPPLLGQVKYMDTYYALRDRADFQKIFHSFPDKQFYIFTGHYHVDKYLKEDNMNIFITPSTYIQIDQKYPEFKVDHRRIGYRKIELTAGGKLLTDVVYQDGHYQP